MNEFDNLDFDTLLDSDNSFLLRENVEDVPPVPTELRISTITAISTTNISINLPNLINCLNKYIIPCSQESSEKSSKEGIITAKYGTITIGQQENKKVRKNKKFFYNQITIVVRISNGNSSSKNINMKIFNNGNLQLTGLKKEQDGHKCIKLFLSHLNKIKESNIPDVFTFKNPNDTIIDYSGFDIVLINTDFCARFKIRRDKLHQILVNQYQIFCSYEPCIYPGVNSKYYWNEDYKNFPNKGICYCSKNCTGKGRGCGNGGCKKVTISIFQSGNVIITGARTFEQINDSYTFINSIFRNHFHEIKRNPSPFLIEEPKNIEPSKVIYIKKSDLVFKNKKIFF